MPNIFAKCCCGGGMICMYCLRLTAVVMATIFGMLVAWKPRKVIGIQIAFYRLINWKMEPISLEREIRNTRIAGLLLIIFSVCAVIMVKVFYVGLGF